VQRVLDAGGPLLSVAASPEGTLLKPGSLLGARTATKALIWEDRPGEESYVPPAPQRQYDLLVDPDRFADDEEVDDEADYEDGDWANVTAAKLATYPATYKIIRPGPPGNKPTVTFSKTAAGDLMFRVSPCSLFSCQEDVPVVRVEIELPVTFSAIYGAFTEGCDDDTLDPADDCAAGKPLDAWEYDVSDYWTQVGERGQAAEGCEVLRDGGVVRSRDECTQACAERYPGRPKGAPGHLMFTRPACNVVHFRPNPPVCELLNCPEPVKLNFLDGYLDNLVLLRVDDGGAKFRDERRHNSHVLFGTPMDLVYHGCEAGTIPKREKGGVVVQLRKTKIGPASVLRWQVAQSTADEAVTIEPHTLRLYIPFYPVVSVDMPTQTTGMQFHPEVPEVLTGFGRRFAAKIDVRGLNFPQGRHPERLRDLVDVLAAPYRVALDNPFQIEYDGLDLADSDELRIVKATEVPTCGSAGGNRTDPSVTLRSKRSYGTHNHSVYPGVVIREPALYLACWCDPRPASSQCCREAVNFASEVTSILVPGPRSDHYVVCETGKACEITDFLGVGLTDGDRIHIQDGIECGIGENPVGFDGESFAEDYPVNGVLTARGGSGDYFRFETFNKPGGNYDVWEPDPPVGKNFLLCWCTVALNAKRCEEPSDFTWQAGEIVVTRFEEKRLFPCARHRPCSVAVKGTPLTAGDVVQLREKPIRAPGTFVDPPACSGGAWVTDMAYGEKQMTKSGHEEIVFDVGLLSVPVGRYDICWCQSRAVKRCQRGETKLVPAGLVDLQDPPYSFPNRCNPRFEGWRGPPWTTFHDCCCNILEAGGLGCHDEQSDEYALCSEYPRFIVLGAEDVAPAR